MYKAQFGTNGQIKFKDEHEYYELLGFLAKSDKTTSLVWENNENQGAWGSEGRIKFFIKNPPFSAQLMHTAGVGNILSRVNCNEFVENIARNHNFSLGGTQDVDLIRKTIPGQYLHDFERGLKL